MVNSFIPESQLILPPHFECSHIHKDQDNKPRCSIIFIQYSKFHRFIFLRFWFAPCFAFAFSFVCRIDRWSSHGLWLAGVVWWTWTRPPIVHVYVFVFVCVFPYFFEFIFLSYLYCICLFVTQIALRMASGWQGLSGELGLREACLYKNRWFFGKFRKGL